MCDNNSNIENINECVCNNVYVCNVCMYVKLK